MDKAEGLKVDIADLRAWLSEEEEALAALREGRADALMGAAGVIGLSGTERPYQIFFQAMNEGGLTLDADGRILHCNPRFSAMVGLPIDALRNRPLADRVVAADRVRLSRFLTGHVVATCEARLLKDSGGTVPVQISQTPMELDGQRLSCLVVSDLTAHVEAERAVHESQALLNLFIQNAPASLAMFDRQMRYLAVNRRWRDDYRLGEREIIGCSYYEIFPEFMAEWKAFHRRCLAGEVVRAEVDRFERADGSIQWLRWELRPWFVSDGEVGGLIIFSEDITLQRHAENQLRVTARVFDQAGEAIVVTGPDNIIQAVNATFTKISGYTVSEAIGQQPSLLKSGRHSNEFYQAMWQAINSKGYWQGEIWNRRKTGETFPEWLTITRVDDERGEVEHYVAVFSDITQIKDSQRKAEFLAAHDALTGLPNRNLFHDRLRHALAQARRNNSRLALMFIDLDNFKTINDTLGHDVGDELLKQVATRLRDAIRDVDTVARLGGDEFTAIISECTAELANQVAARIIDDLAAAYTIREHSLYISASIGIAFYPEDGVDSAELIKAADAAMYRAKEQGRNRVEFFVPDLRVRLLKRAMLESALRAALRHNRLRLVFQPKIALREGHPVVGAEALLRWRDPELGDVSPAEFIPAAEASGLILEIGRETHRLLLHRLVEWRALGLSVPPVALNVSPRCIREASFAEQLVAEIAAAGLPSNCVQVEITEGALLENSDNVVANLEKLATAGIGISIDDFGTGYSSLSYLKRLPLTELKIDKSFVDGLGQDKEDEAIARAVLALAHALDLKTVAEGVETVAQLDWLTQMGCDIAQGYYFARPLEADDFKNLIEAKGREG